MKKITIIAFAIIFSTTLIFLNSYAEVRNHSIYVYKAKTIDGEEISLEKFKGKILLIVNVASKCGFTPQYKGLQELYEKYHDKGLEILGFPCNQFRNQEPGTNKEIKEFCTREYGVTFPMFSKIEVNGPDAHPLFQYLTSDGEKPIRWNFEKFLVDRNGLLVQRFGTKTEPKEIEELIVKLLSQKEAR